MAGLLTRLLCLLASCVAMLHQPLSLHIQRPFSRQRLMSIQESCVGVEGHDNTWHKAALCSPSSGSNGTARALQASLQVENLPMAYVHSIEFAQGNTDRVHACTWAERTFPVLWPSILNERSLVVQTFRIKLNLL